MFFLKVKKRIRNLREAHLLLHDHTLNLYDTNKSVNDITATFGVLVNITLKFSCA